MNLNLGICREEEKNVKKQALIDYMLSHLKVRDFSAQFPALIKLLFSFLAP